MMRFSMDPRMQRIIDNASANVQDDPYPYPPFSHPLIQPPSQPAFNRHFSNSISLQDRFAFRPPQHPLPLPPQNVLESFDRQVSRSDVIAQQLQRHDTSASRLSLTPRSLQAVPAPATIGDETINTSGISNGARRTANRASTLANLRTQPPTIRLAQPQRSPNDTPAFPYAVNRISQLQPLRQQPSPPFNLAGHSFTPPGQRSPSPALPLSSPTRRIVSRREARATQRTQSAEFRFTNTEISPHNTSQAITFEGNSGTRGSLDLSHAPPIINGIQLISTRELPDRFRLIFPFQLFNAMQSKVFSAAYKGDDNVVVSAPTGGGKTVILELAIVRIIQSHTPGQFKIVYQAPTKSLCSEKARDWTVKFGNLNIATAELTGDTDAAEMHKVGNATIIVTTPEKWDSITRKWKDYIKLLQLVKLFLIDEVHILKENRGATLEAVVSRMKSIGTNVRFVALSATVPNSHDIAVWLGKNHTNSHLPALRETFGEEFRPVKLQKHVHGFDSNINNYAFDTFLDGKLPTLIAKYTHKKPIIVFCFTRKSCENTATKLSEWWMASRVVDRAWLSPTERVAVGSKDLQELVSRGVAYHHAGLDAGDRMAIEKAYLKGQISVICCTSTLAVGVNLPCHLVVLKGTVGYQDGGLEEYSDLEVMQMLGRAGRPQFDDTAVAIIMTRQYNTDRYKRMISGQDILESTLHLNLIEHLNSEIGLGTVHNLYSAKHWLAGTFMSVRMKQNPTFYKFSSDTGSGDPDERLEQVCERDIKMLQDTKLVTSDRRFTCTEYGKAMSRYMVKFETMQLLLSIPEHAGICQILHIISQASEFKDLRMKPTERASFREFNKSPLIKYPIKENVSTTPHKISLIIQVQLGGIDTSNDKEFNRRQYQTEKVIVFERIHRLVRCVVDCKAVDCDALATQNALELSRSISAEYWEHLPSQLRQIPNIGPAAVKKMVTAGIKTIEKLVATDSATIERALSRNPPFGQKLLDMLKEFPRLSLKAEIVGRIVKSGQLPKVKIRVQLGFINPKLPFWRHRSISLTFMASISNGNLAHFWRGNIKHLERGFEVHFTAELSSSSDAISCFLACDEIVGTAQSIILAPNIPESAFTVPQLVQKAVSKILLSNESGDGDSDAEFEWDECIADQDLLAAVKLAEESIGQTVDDNVLSDRFIDIDDITTQQTIAPQAITDLEQPKPVQMANGKWMCNHICRDGNETRNGRICKHKCCHDGLDKPRKLPKKVKQDSSKVAKETSVGEPDTKTVGKLPRQHLTFKDLKNDSCQIGNVEIIDLSDNLSPIPYEAISPRDYRKLHALHSQVSNSEPVQTLRNNKPLALYGHGTQPYETFLQECTHPQGAKDRDDLSGDDLPSPSKLLGIDDEVGDDAYPGYVADLADVESFFGASGEQISDIYFCEAEQMPDATSSFVNSVIDYDECKESNDPPSSPDPKSLKRGTSLDPSQPPEKRARVGDGCEVQYSYHLPKNMNTGTGDLSKPEASFSSNEDTVRPEWLREFDANLVAMFEGIVDFCRVIASHIVLLGWL